MFSQQNDIKVYAAYNLIGIANLFSLQGKSAEAVALLAAVTALAKSIGFKIEPELQEPYDKTLVEVQKILSQEDFQSAWAEGEQMDLKDAVKFAEEKYREHHS